MANAIARELVSIIRIRKASRYQEVTIMRIPDLNIKKAVVGIPSGEKGVALVFMLIFLSLCLIALFTLVFDLGFWLISMKQAKYHSDQAAFSAFETVLSESGIDKDGNPLEFPLFNKRVERARAQVAWFLANNPLLGKSHARSLPNVVYGFKENPEAGKLYLSVGIYFTSADEHDAFENLELLVDCLSPESYPVFCPYASSALGDDPPGPINALQLSGEPYEPYHTMFLKYLGAKTFDMEVKSIATILPPELYFVVDISGSMVGYTHPRDRIPAILPQLPINPAEYVFLLQADSHGRGRIITDDWFEDLEKDVPPQYVNVDIRRHFQNDYRCYANPDFTCPGNEWVGDPFTTLPREANSNSALEDSEYQAGSYNFAGKVANYSEVHPNPANPVSLYTSAQYTGPVRVDRAFYSRCDVPKTDCGPRPLLDVLQGLDRLITQIKNRSFSGMRVGMTFFDGSSEFSPLGWSRIYRSLPIDKLWVLEELITDENTAQGDDPKNPENTVSTLGVNDVILQKLVRNGIFPNAESFTDVWTGIMEGVVRLKKSREEGAQTKQRLIFVSADGLSNCYHENYDYKATFTDQPLGSGAPYDPGIVHCGITLEYYRRSIAQVRELADLLAKNGIPLDVILIGGEESDVQPHTALIGDPNSTTTPPKCLTQEDAKKIFADGETIQFSIPSANCGSSGSYEDCNTGYQGRSSTNPFLDVSGDWISIAWRTGGNFYPIYPQSHGVTCYCPMVCGTNAEQQKSSCNSGNTCESPKKQMGDIIDTLIKKADYRIVPL